MVCSVKLGEFVVASQPVDRRAEESRQAQSPNLGKRDQARLNPNLYKQGDEAPVGPNTDEEGMVEDYVPIESTPSTAPTLNELVARNKAKIESEEANKKKEQRPEVEAEEHLTTEVAVARTYLFDYLFVDHQPPTVSLDWIDFYRSEDPYFLRPGRAFTQDVLLAGPQNIVCSYEEQPRLGLTAEFDSEMTITEISDCPESPQPKSLQHGSETTRLHRFGAHTYTPAEAICVFDAEEPYYAEFQTGGILLPSIEQSTFLKRRLEQDLTALLNDHYKDVLEEEVPEILSCNDASAIMAQKLPLFLNVVDSRNHQDREATDDGFKPANRLKTNIVEAEIKRRHSIAETQLAKRAPDLSDIEVIQLERERQKQLKKRERRRIRKAERGSLE